MSMSPPSPTSQTNPPRNRLLAALSASEFARVCPQLEHVPLEMKRVLFDVDTPIEYVYFPESGVVSVLGVMPDGSAVETATIGYEGIVGLPVANGTDRTTAQAVVQIPGDALRIPADDFRTEIARDETLSRMVRLYSQALFTLIAQSSACNRLHSIQQRCARWLLHSHDRVGTNEFPLTHQFLSQMIGVRRASVTEAMGALHSARSVTYLRGIVTITSRRELERSACGCYAIIQREFDRLLKAPDATGAGHGLANPLADLETSVEGESTLGDASPPVRHSTRGRRREPERE